MSLLSAKNAGHTGLNRTTQAVSSTSTWYAFAGHVIRRRTLPHFGGVFGAQASFSDLLVGFGERRASWIIRSHAAVMILPENGSMPLTSRSFRTLSSIAVLGLISAFRMFFICRREYSVSSVVFEATQSAGTHNL